MSNIADVIGWKFNHQEGMICKGNSQGMLEITGFPGGIPSQIEQDLWTQEYSDYLIANPIVTPITADELFEALVTRGILNTLDRPTRL